jgi:predicted phage terminase large subunit-like protein
MIDFIRERLDKHENAVILEPRGHAKTTWANTIFLSWLISCHPGIRVGLVSRTATQAFAFSRAIRWNLQANEYQHEVFGDLTGTHKWTDSEWIQKDSPLHGTKDTNLYAVGAGGAPVSKRFDVIICDDIIDDENSATPEAREKILTWFNKTLRPCLVPGGSIIVIGTRWMADDLYETLMKRGWPSLIRSAIWYEESDKNQTEPRALWPAVWPLDKLEAERKDMGSAMFACAYLNDISGLMEGNIFRREWFRYFDGLPPDNELVWKMGVDLAASERESADYTARVVIAEDSQFNTYVMSVSRERIETGHRGFIVEGYNAFPSISRIIVENNQFQTALVKDLLSSTPLPIIGKRAEVDKVTRSRSVAARYESGKVFHHRSLAGSDFETELLSFPKGHDDMVDALGYAMETGSRGFFFGTFSR